MIPIDHFQLNDDGTAWIIVEDEIISFTLAIEWWMDLKRPCDKCEGHGVLNLPAWYDSTCPACGSSGRHTFTVEVQCPNVDSWGDPCQGDYEIAQSEWRPCPLCDGGNGKEGKVGYRVDILGIYQVDDQPHFIPYVELTDTNGIWLHDKLSTGWVSTKTDFPPAIKLDTYAIKVQILQSIEKSTETGAEIVY